MAYPDPFVQFAVYLIDDCACDPAGSCYQQCTDPMDDFCNDLSADPAKCEACLGALTTAPCLMKVTMDCNADPSCKPALDCISTCPTH
jgi:hypothetical protein